MALISKLSRQPVPFLLLCGLIALAAGCTGPSLQTEPAFAPPDRTYLVVQPETLNVRSCPETNCQVIALLTQGETVAVRRFSGEWSEIETKGRSIGWVASHFLGAIQTRRDSMPEPAMPEEELAGPHAIRPPEIQDELADPQRARGQGNSPPAISEELAQ